MGAEVATSSAMTQAPHTASLSPRVTTHSCSQEYGLHAGRGHARHSLGLTQGKSPGDVPVVRPPLCPWGRSSSECEQESQWVSAGVSLTQREAPPLGSARPRRIGGRTGGTTEVPRAPRQEGTAGASEEQTQSVARPARNLLEGGPGSEPSCLRRRLEPRPQEGSGDGLVWAPPRIVTDAERWRSASEPHAGGRGFPGPSSLLTVVTIALCLGFTQQGVLLLGVCAPFMTQ